MIYLNIICINVVSIFLQTYSIISVEGKYNYFALKFTL